MRLPKTEVIFHAVNQSDAGAYFCNLLPTWTSRDPVQIGQKDISGSIMREEPEERIFS